MKKNRKIDFRKDIINKFESEAHHIKKSNVKKLVPPFCSCKWPICFMFYTIGGLKKPQKTVISMEDGAVDTTVIAGGQHNMG